MPESMTPLRSPGACCHNDIFPEQVEVTYILCNESPSPPEPIFPVSSSSEQDGTHWQVADSSVDNDPIWAAVTSALQRQFELSFEDEWWW